VAQTLRHNGRSFLIDAFHGNRELADSVNHLLVVAFTSLTLDMSRSLCILLPKWQRFAAP